MRPPTLRSATALAADKPHGVRMRYVGGCRCLPCRAANSRYETERLRARREGDWNGIVPAARTRRHLFQLSRAGVGRRAASEAADVSVTVIASIKSKVRLRIRARTERRILDVTAGARCGGSLVSAAPTWKRIRRLLAEGFSKAEIARRLGYRREALQLNKDRITAENAMRVERLFRRVME